MLQSGFCYKSRLCYDLRSVQSGLCSVTVWVTLKSCFRQVWVASTELCFSLGWFIVRVTDNLSGFRKDLIKLSMGLVKSWLNPFLD